MSQNNQLSETPETGKREELSAGKQALVKGWRSFTKLCSQNGMPLTGETMGKKMIWGIGGAILGHFSGMGWIGTIVSGLTGMIFNDNIKGMGNSLNELFKGNISITDKKVLAPLLGGLAGFGLSAFGLKAGFLASLMFGITGASVTDSIMGNQKERQVPGQKATGLSQEKEVKENNLKQSSGKYQQVKNCPEQTMGLNKRQTNQLPARLPSDENLLTAIKNAPNGLQQIRDRFPDSNTYNDFIARNGLKTEQSRQNMNKFEGRLPVTAQIPTSEIVARGTILEEEKQNIKIGLS